MVLKWFFVEPKNLIKDDRTSIQWDKNWNEDFGNYKT